MSSPLDLLRPTFVWYDEHVVIAEDTCNEAPESFASRTAFDAFATHMHVLDVRPDLEVPWLPDETGDGARPDSSHPQFEQAWTLAKRAAHAWAEALARQFPARRFRVYATKLPDPVVRFHTVWPGEDPWYSDRELAATIAVDEAVVIATGPTGTL